MKRAIPVPIHHGDLSTHQLQLLEKGDLVGFRPAGRSVRPDDNQLPPRYEGTGGESG